MKKEDLKIGWYLANVDTDLPPSSQLAKNIDKFCEDNQGNEELYTLITKEAEINNVQADQITHYEFLSNVNMIIHGFMQRKFLDEKKFWVDGLYFMFKKPVKDF